MFSEETRIMTYFRQTLCRKGKERYQQAMSNNIKIKNAVKRFGDNTIISGLSLDVKEGEFFTLLGPSGCGKTTLLRMIAGFNTIEGGDFYFNEQRINDLDPAKRNIGMVFQNYAIFPHMTVRKNVAFGLKNRKIAADDIAAQTEKFMKLMHINEYADRMPDRLSGGQQQRVALARALVIQPGVLLMDEPLSNLDAKLRVEMRTVIKNIQRSVGITTVYVTHDQEEAMAISDRIAVMKDGVIQHIGTPISIYQRPANLFVSTFIGRSNIVEADLVMKAGMPSVRFANGYEVEMPNVREEHQKNQRVLVSLRPEELLINPTEDHQGLRAKTEDSVFLGLNTNYFVSLETGEKVEIIVESDIGNIIPPGEEISLRVNARKLNLFTLDGEENILTGICNDNAAPTSR